MTKMLIVGGAGFIGSHLVDVCLAQACQVWVFDNFSTGRKAFLPQHPALRVIEGDILNQQTLFEAVEACNPDIVIHLAAIHHIPTCEEHPQQAIRVNIEGLQNVISACARFEVPRILFTSTGALYDPNISGALSETSQTKAHDIYSICKLTGENLLRYSGSKNAHQVIVARLFNTVGCRETNAHLVPAIMEQLARGNRQIRLGNLHPRRDYVHVEDVVDALLTLTRLQNERSFDVFNVGAGREYTVRELVEICAEVIGEPIEIISAAELQRKVDRLGQLADLTKIERDTGWKPSRNLKQALGAIWQETRSRIDARNIDAI